MLWWLHYTFKVEIQHLYTRGPGYVILIVWVGESSNTSPKLKCEKDWILKSDKRFSQGKERIQRIPCSGDYRR